MKLGGNQKMTGARRKRRWRNGAPRRGGKTIASQHLISLPRLMVSNPVRSINVYRAITVAKHTVRGALCALLALATYRRHRRQPRNIGAAARVAAGACYHHRARGSRCFIAMAACMATYSGSYGGRVSHGAAVKRARTHGAAYGARQR
jgi:hypothetical protein